MSKVSEFIKREYDEHHRLLQETEEHAHAHTLWIRRCESAQQFLGEHFPHSPTRDKMLSLIQELRQLTGKALESKQ